MRAAASAVNVARALTRPEHGGPGQGVGSGKMPRGSVLAPQEGLEPPTLRLTAGCSTIELLRSTKKLPRAAGVSFYTFAGDLSIGRRARSQQGPSEARADHPTGAGWNLLRVARGAIRVTLGFSSYGQAAADERPWPQPIGCHANPSNLQGRFHG